MSKIAMLISSFLLAICLQSTAQNSHKIGTQVWMNENLNVKKFRNGDTIQQAQSDEDWKKAGLNHTPAWCYNTLDSGLFNLRSVFYNRYALYDKRGLAPQGWHIPSNKEWNVLISYFGGFAKAGYKFLQKKNLVGFNAVLAGWRDVGIGDIGEEGYWWSVNSSSLEDETEYFYIRKGNVVYNNRTNWLMGFSVRCVKD